MKNCRFMANNFLENGFDYSSQLTAAPATNIYSTSRSRLWRPGGNFDVTASNNKIYINDGTNKTITLTVGAYTYSTLATHIQTQLNATSSNWTCAYSTTTFKFTIDRSSGTEVLRQSQTTDAAWDMLGYTLGTDLATAPFVADEQRNHTSEWVICDMGVPSLPTFVGLWGEIDEVFTLSSEAVVKIQANNFDSWDSPPVDQAITIYDNSALAILDTIIPSSYRYFRIEIIDRRNTLGPEGLRFGYGYIGDHVSMDFTNVASGFSKTLQDPSNVQSSENGALFFEVRPRFLEISGAEIQLLTGNDRAEIEQLFYDLGIRTPFVISIDPDASVTADLEELTRIMVMTDSPELQHVFRSYYNVSFSMREAF